METSSWQSGNQKSAPRSSHQLDHILFDIIVYLNPHKCIINHNIKLPSNLVVSKQCRFLLSHCFCSFMQSCLLSMHLLHSQNLFYPMASVTLLLTRISVILRCLKTNQPTYMTMAGCPSRNLFQHPKSYFLQSIVTYIPEVLHNLRPQYLLFRIAKFSSVQMWICYQVLLEL